MELKRVEIEKIINWLIKIQNFLDKHSELYIGLDIIIKTKIDYEILLNKIIINYLIEYKNKQKVEDINAKEKELLKILLKLTHQLMIIANDSYNYRLKEELNLIISTICTKKNLEYINALINLIKLAETNKIFVEEKEKYKKDIKTIKKIIAYLDLFINENNNTLDKNYVNELRVYIYRIFVLIKEELDYFMFSFEYTDKKIKKELKKLRIEEVPFVKQIEVYPLVSIPENE